MKQFRSFSAWIGLQQPEKLRKSKKAAAGEESKFVTGLNCSAVLSSFATATFYLFFIYLKLLTYCSFLSMKKARIRMEQLITYKLWRY